MTSQSVVFDAKTKIWGSMEHQEPYDPTMFGQMILDSLSKYGSRLAQVKHCTKILI